MLIKPLAYIFALNQSSIIQFIIIGSREHSGNRMVAQMVGRINESNSSNMSVHDLHAPPTIVPFPRTMIIMMMVAITSNRTARMSNVLPEMRFSTIQITYDLSTRLRFTVGCENRVPTNTVTNRPTLVDTIVVVLWSVELNSKSIACAQAGQVQRAKSPPVCKESVCNIPINVKNKHFIADLCMVYTWVYYSLCVAALITLCSLVCITYPITTGLLLAHTTSELKNYNYITTCSAMLICCIAHSRTHRNAYNRNASDYTAPPPPPLCPQRN